MLASILALVLAAEPSEVDAAQERADRASVLWAERKLEEAEAELQAAYALHPYPKYLYGLGMIAKDRGDCGAATEYFERFLEALPGMTLADESKRGSIEAEAKDALAACEREAPRADPPPPTAATPRAVATSTPTSTSDPAPPIADSRPWHRDPAATALLAVGAVAVVTGGGLLIGGSVTDRGLPDADTASAFRSERRRARALGTAGVVTIAVGGALLVASVIRYALVGAKLTGRKRTARTAGRTRWSRR